MQEIDLVIPWVDGSDKEWQKVRDGCRKNRIVNDGYYRDWGWMRYWFRCVETNMPWIRKIFFVTYGHIPEWLNLNHPKLVVVRHEDYMPQEFLPTFNSCTISLNVHRIKGLSETFIYAEDDIFFIGTQRAEDYFSESGLPRDYFWLKPITEQFSGDFAHIMLNNVMTLKKHFKLQEVLDRQENIFEQGIYPEKIVRDNLRCRDMKYIPGFDESHMAYAFLKSTFEEVWDREAMELYTNSMHRFRAVSDHTVSLMKGWQLAEGKYSPYYPSGRYFTGTDDADIEEKILDEHTNMICINESEKSIYSKERAEEICSYFEKRFPERSQFEAY